MTLPRLLKAQFVCRWYDFPRSNYALNLKCLALSVPEVGGGHKMLEVGRVTLTTPAQWVVYLALATSCLDPPSYQTESVYFTRSMHR